MKKVRIRIFELLRGTEKQEKREGHVAKSITSCTLHEELQEGYIGLTDEVGCAFSMHRTNMITCKNLVGIYRRKR